MESKERSITRSRDGGRKAKRDDDSANPWDSIGWPICPKCILMIDFTEAGQIECQECDLIRV